MIIIEIKTNNKNLKIVNHPYKDLRCSRGCIHNYLKFNQTPPNYVICECCKKI